MQGFYGVYDALFSRLAQREANAQPGNDANDTPPTFGKQCIRNVKTESDVLG